MLATLRRYLHRHCLPETTPDAHRARTLHDLLAQIRRTHPYHPLRSLVPVLTVRLDAELKPLVVELHNADPNAALPTNPGDLISAYDTLRARRKRTTERLGHVKANYVKLLVHHVHDEALAHRIVGTTWRYLVSELTQLDPNDVHRPVAPKPKVPAAPSPASTPVASLKDLR